MPENPGGYKAIPPVTVTRAIGGITAPRTNVGAAPITHASPEAMADPKQAARMLKEVQIQLSRVTSQQTSDPHTGRVIIADVVLTGGAQKLIAHGLGRAFIGWSWNRPRIAAPTIFEVPATLQAPADKFLTIQSGITCTVDIEVW